MTLGAHETNSRGTKAARLHQFQDRERPSGRRASLDGNRPHSPTKVHRPTSARRVARSPSQPSQLRRERPRACRADRVQPATNSVHLLFRCADFRDLWPTPCFKYGVGARSRSRSGTERRIRARERNSATCRKRSISAVLQLRVARHRCETVHAPESGRPWTGALCDQEISQRSTSLQFHVEVVQHELWVCHEGLHVGRHLSKPLINLFR